MSLPFGKTHRDPVPLRRTSAGKIGNMLAVKVSYRQGIAGQFVPGSWVGGSNPVEQALTGERIDWV